MRCRRDGGALPLPLAGEGWGGGLSAGTSACGERFPHPPLISFASTSAASGKGEEAPEIGWHITAPPAKLATMKSAANTIIHPAPSAIAARIDANDWAQASRDLDAQGCTVLKGLLSPEECRVLASLYPDDKHFR